MSNPILALLDRLDALEAKVAALAVGDPYLLKSDSWVTDRECVEARIKYCPTLSRALRIAVEQFKKGQHPQCVGQSACAMKEHCDEVWSVMWCNQSCAALSEIAALAKETK